MRHHLPYTLFAAAFLAVSAFLVFQSAKTRGAAEGAYQELTRIGARPTSEVLLTMSGTWNFSFDCEGMTVTFTCTGEFTECKKLAKAAQEECGR